MKREIMKVAVCGMLTVCVAVSTGFSGIAAETRSETQKQIPKEEAVVAETREWHKKAFADTEGEAAVYETSDKGSRVVGKIYKNTIVDLKEKGEKWSKISSGEVTGYVDNESLAFGLNAVKRADEVCPEVEKYTADGELVSIRETQDAKTTEKIEMEEEARRAAAEAKRKAEEEARRKAEEARKKAEAEARKKAEAEARKKAAREAARKRAREEAARKAAMKKAAAKTSRAKVSASVSDRSLLAAIIFCEAGGEPYQGKVAVGAVIMNRVRSRSFPNSISGVIYQRGQFGPAVTGKLQRVLSAGKATASCYQAADAALAGANPIGNALYFGNGNRGQRIGGHYFH